MKRTLAISVLILVMAATAWAAFVATENFDSYTTASDLNGASGGTNWTSNWTGTASTWSIQTEPGGMSGKAAKNTTADGSMIRNYASEDVGTLRFKMRTSITNPNDFLGVVVLGGTGDSEMFVRFGPTGNIELYDFSTTSYVSVAAYSANTTYTIDIDWDNPGHPNQYRVRVDGGTYSAYKTVETGSYITTAGIRIDASATGTRDFWIDDISTPSATTSTPFLSLTRRRR